MLGCGAAGVKLPVAAADDDQPELRIDPATEQYLRRVMDGSARGARAAALRVAMRCAETSYATAMSARNRLYDAGILRATKLPRPVVSVGNITSGGTGKTPVVRWLAGRLRDDGRRIAVLSRGYKSGAAGTLGDEQLMLERALNAPGNTNAVTIRANPSRLDAAARVLREQPGTDVVVLDDGFQHRKVERDFDLLLINATEPFGFGHVLPRGLLREPLSGLRRAHAILLTHADEVSAQELGKIIDTVRRHNPAAPIYRSSHSHSGFRTTVAAPSGPADLTLDALRGRRYFVFSGIGDPESLERQLGGLGGTPVGSRRFPDHARYTADDLTSVRGAAHMAIADVVLTTEKDWVKVEPLMGAYDGPAVWRVDLDIRFEGNDGEMLLSQIRRVLPPRQR